MTDSATQHEPQAECVPLSPVVEAMRIPTRLTVPVRVHLLRCMEEEHVTSLPHGE